MNDEMLQEIADILGIEPDLDTGNSGEWVYGNYIDWPNLESLDDSLLEAIFSLFKVQLPYEQNVYVENLIDFSFSGEFNSNINKEIINKVKFYNDENQEIEVQEIYTDFPSFNELQEEIIIFLRMKGIPEGVKYENDLHYPEWGKHWNIEDDGYYLLEKYNVDYDKCIYEIKEIAEVIKNVTNPLIIKTMILAIFTFVESFINSEIVKQAKKDNYSLTDLSNLYRNIRITKERKKVFRTLFLKELEDIPNINLRNCLAHDLSIVEVYKNIIAYRGNDNLEIIVETDEVIESLLDYASNFNKIANI